MAGTQREMTLEEWCATLPEGHRVRKELAALRAERDAALRELNKWRKWDPDDEDLKMAKDQYGDGSSRGATGVYVAMLEHKLRSVIAERDALLAKLDREKLAKVTRNASYEWCSSKEVGRLRIDQDDFIADAIIRYLKEGK